MNSAMPSRPRLRSAARQVLYRSGAPAWMKLITTFPLEHSDIATASTQGPANNTLGQPRLPPTLRGARGTGVEMNAKSIE